MSGFDNHFRSIIDKFGPPSTRPAADTAMLEEYGGRAPEALLAFWAAYGLGFWRDGYFHLCDPRRYRPVVDAIFRGDPDFRPEEIHVYGMSAFGHLLAWSETRRIARVDIISHAVRCPDFFKPKPHISVVTSLYGADDEGYDALDRDGQPMFRRAVRKYGTLSYGQIYAPRLHPALGGDLVLENFRPASALEALVLSAEAAPFHLKDTLSRPPRIAREIGAS